MLIFIQSFPDKKTTIEVSHTDTVANIKALIYEKEGTLPERQRLVFHGVELEDDQTMADCKITKEETLDLELRGPVTLIVQIDILNKDQRIEVNVQDTDTIEVLKRKIERKQSIPVTQQRLYSGDKEMEDSHPVSEYNTQGKTRIFLTYEEVPPPSSPPSFWGKCCPWCR